jgi:DNA-binding response OmpR family regulator
MSAPTSPEAAVQDSAEPIVDICVVDYDVAMVEMLCDTLTNYGYRCFGTTDPYEGLRYVGKVKGRIVLCDLNSVT